MLHAPTPDHSSLTNSVRLWRQDAFRAGVREMTPAALGIAAWGFVTGIAMVKSGMSVGMALLMNALVYAGSAQLAAMPLMAVAAPLWVIWAAAFCVNLRFVIFSAGFRPYFSHRGRWDRMRLAYFAGDINYVLFMRRYPVPSAPDSANDTASQAEALASQRQAHWAYFWGTVAVNYVAWHVASTAGIVLGDRIPSSWGLAFAGTLALIGLAGTLIVDRSTIVAAVVAGCAALAAWALPLKLNILVAIAAAVAVGALMDRFNPKRPEAPVGP